MKGRAVQRAGYRLLVTGGGARATCQKDLRKAEPLTVSTLGSRRSAVLTMERTSRAPCPDVSQLEATGPIAA